MKKNVFKEIIEELKKFVFKKSAVIFFLVPLIIFFIITRFTDLEITQVFFSDLMNSLIISILSLLSIIIDKPLVAYSSALARQWPLKWYWHSKVKPAYKEVTFFWFIYFSIKFIVQWLVIKQFFINFLLGWPSMIILLIASYIYGQKRLQQLQGPGVEEFKKNRKPPWEGQKKGF